MFCPKCKSMMMPKDGRWLCRRCGYTLETDEKETIVTERLEDKEILLIDENSGTLPTARVECPKCGHNEAYWVIRQTRAADEPETRIYRCVKCSHTWREY